VNPKISARRKFPLTTVIQTVRAPSRPSRRLARVGAAARGSESVTSWCARCRLRRRGAFPMLVLLARPCICVAALASVLLAAQLRLVMAHSDETTQQCQRRLLYVLLHDPSNCRDGFPKDCGAACAAVRPAILCCNELICLNSPPWLSISCAVACSSTSRYLLGIVLDTGVATCGYPVHRFHSGTATQPSCLFEALRAS
jgi:hypothetical protein